MKRRLAFVAGLLTSAAALGADRRISEFPVADTLTGDEIIPLVQTATTKRATLDEIAAFIGAPANVAIKTLTNTFTQVNTFNETLTLTKDGTGLNSAILISPNTGVDEACIAFYEDDATTGKRFWNECVDGGEYKRQILADNGTSPVDYLLEHRGTTTMESVKYTTDIFHVNGTLLLGVGQNNSRLLGKAEYTSAPAATLGSGEWEVAMYDDATAPVLNLRYNDSGTARLARIPLNTGGGFSPASSAITVTAGTGLTGGGDLTANRTLGITAGGVGNTELGASAVGSSKIANDAVTYAKIQNVTSSRLLGRVTAGSGDTEELTGTQATTLLDAFTTSLKGVAPASGGGTTNFLRADGAWAAPPATVTTSGTYTATLVGCTTSPTVTVNWVKTGSHVGLMFDSNVSCTSNSTGFSLSGAPSTIQPSGGLLSTGGRMCGLTDNGTNGYCGYAYMDSSGNLSLSLDTVSGTKIIAGNWTSSGSKGLIAGNPNGLMYVLVPDPP